MRHVGRHPAIYGIGVVLLVWVAGVVLTTQGWRSRVPAFDLLTYIHSANDLLATGALPQHGDVGSYGSFKPAGTAWLMLPSTILLDDPRLAEYVGTAFLHLATLLGLFLLARKYFGSWCAVLAVTLYGLSAIGLFLAGSLWPNGRPDFFVWIVYLASEWVTRRQARYLAAALAVWGVGMQVDMALAPALLVLPVLWAVYRPPVRLRPLAVAGALVLIVWAPYLRFEAPRDFVDVRSQLLLDYVAPASYRDAWCDPTLTLRRAGDDGAGEGATGPELEGPLPAAADEVGRGPAPLPERIWTAVDDRLLSNFETVVPTAGAAILLLAVGATLVLASVPVRASGSRPGAAGRRRGTAVAAGLLVVGLLAYGIGSLLGGDAQLVALLQRLGKLLTAGAGAFLAAVWTSAGADRLLARAGIELQTEAWAERRRLLALSLLVPWVVLVVAAEPGKPERFWWLWPLQVLCLSAFVGYYLPRLRGGRLLAGTAQALLVAVIVWNSFLVARVDDWRAAGWSGREAPEVAVVDYLAERLRADGRERASIGYHVFLYRFMASYHVIDPQYKVGAEFDLLLRYRHGIGNSNGCAEGLSPRDEYRIVRRTPRQEDWGPREYFVLPLDDDFRRLARFGPYEVFARA